MFFKKKQKDYLIQDKTIRVGEHRFTPIHRVHYNQIQKTHILGDITPLGLIHLYKETEHFISIDEVYDLEDIKKQLKN